MDTESYRTLCSLETLRSEKRGFFRDFSERVFETAGEVWIRETFGKVSTDEDRVRNVFRGKIRDTVLETLSRVRTLYRDKDAKISRSKRLEGHQAATAADYGKALMSFNQAVVRAPSTGKCPDVDRGFSLSLALLGRADVFMAMNEYDRALEDLNLAVESQLPEQSQTEAIRKMEECEKWLESTRNSLVPANLLLRDSTSSRKPLPRLTGGENPGMPGGSTLLEIRETPTAGKYAVASKEIRPGDVLVVEPPLVATLLPEFFGTHCHHCFSRLHGPIGCSECGSVAFCGRKCRDVATATYHKYECKILALLIGSGMSALSSLALRMVTQEGPDRCLRIHRALRDPECENGDPNSSSNPEEPTPIVEETKLGKSAKRRIRKKKLKESRCEANEAKNDETPVEKDQLDLRAYDLVRHEGSRRAEDFFERSLMAAFLVKCLQRVDFFSQPTKDNETPNEDEIAVAALLLKNLQLVQFNAHEFYETRVKPEHRFRGSRAVYIGVALYPTVARFNHDCYPAVTRYFVGRHIVIRATRCLNPGDVVAENYGPIFTKRTLEERRRTLTGRYWFRCTCTACLEDWPTFQHLTNDTVGLKCPTSGCDKRHRRGRDTATKSIKCSSCRKRIDLSSAMESLRNCEQLYDRGFATMDEEKPEQAIDIFIEATTKFHDIAKPPHKDTHLAEIALSSCMADSGNTWRAPN